MARFDISGQEVADSLLNKVWCLWPEKPDYHSRHKVTDEFYRMASIDELMTLPNRASTLPTTAPPWLGDYRGRIWAREVCATHQNKAWYVDMKTGEVGRASRWRCFGALYLRDVEVDTTKYVPTVSCTLAEAKARSRLPTFVQLSVMNQAGQLKPGQYWVEADLATTEKGFGLTFSTGLPFACGRASPSIRCLCLI